MKYHALKLNFQGRKIGYRVSDEVLKWLFAPDYSTYLKRCSILEAHVASNIYEKVNQIIKEKNNASNDNS